MSHGALRSMPYIQSSYRSRCTVIFCSQLSHQVNHIIVKSKNNCFKQNVGRGSVGPHAPSVSAPGCDSCPVCPILMVAFSITNNTDSYICICIALLTCIIKNGHGFLYNREGLWQYQRAASMPLWIRDLGIKINLSYTFV